MALQDFLFYHKKKSTYTTRMLSCCLKETQEFSITVNLSRLASSSGLKVKSRVLLPPILLKELTGASALERQKHNNKYIGNLT